MEIFKLFGSIFLKSDEADKTLDKVDKKAQGLDKTLAKMGKSVTNAGKTMSTWVTGPIVAAGAGILGLATKAGNTADRLLDLASITGMSTDAIQEYQYVAKIAGVNTEAITNAAEGFIKRLPQIQAEGGRASEVLQGLGVAVEGTADEIMNNMLVALSSIEDPLDRNAKGSQLFGGAWKDLAPILDIGTDGIAKAREEAQKLGIVMDNDALNSANNFRIEMDKLKAMFGAVFLEIGTKFAPLLQDILIPLVQDKVIPILIALTDKVSRVIDWFANLDGTTQTVILTIVGIVAAIGPLLLIVGKVMTVISKLIPIAKSLGVVIGALTSPIGLTILAIGALVAAVVYLWKTNEDFRNNVTKLWYVIADNIKKVFDKIKAFWDKWGDAIKIYFETVFENIKHTFAAALNILVNSLRLVIALLTGDWVAVWDSFKGILKSAWNGIKNVFVNSLDGIFKIFGKSFDDFVVSAKQFGVDIVKGLWNGINSMSKWIKDKVTGFVTSIGSTVKEFFGISSPSKLMAEYGKFIAEGLAQGITDNAEMVARATEKFGDAVVKEMDKLGQATIDALRKRYDQEERLQIESLDKQGEALRRQTNRNIREYDRELLAKLKLIDDGTNEELKALQERIDGIENLTEQEEKELKEREYQQRLSDKIQQIEMEQDYEKRLKLLQELSAMKADRERRDILETRKNQIESLRSEMDLVRTNADQKRQEMIKEVEAKKNNQKTLELITLGGLNDEKQHVIKHYDEMRKEENLEQQARLLIQDNNNKELIQLLESYNPKWLDAGRSFGESLLNGLNEKKRQIQRTVEQLMYMVGQVGMSVQSQSLNVPALANGGNITRAGRVMVGEQGPELLDLPKGATVTPLDKAGGITININNPHLFNERDADKLGQLIVGRLRTATGLRV